MELDYIENVNGLELQPPSAPSSSSLFFGKAIQKKEPSLQ